LGGRVGQRVTRGGRGLGGRERGGTRVWDAATGQPRLTVDNGARELSEVVWSPDGTRLATELAHVVSATAPEPPLWPLDTAPPTAAELVGERVTVLWWKDGGGEVRWARGGARGEPAPVALPARELVALPIGEIGHPRILHGPPNGVVVLAGPSAQQRLVREATAGDEVPDGDPRRRRRGLGQKA